MVRESVNKGSIQGKVQEMRWVKNMLKGRSQEGLYFGNSEVWECVVRRKETKLEN